MSVLLWDKVGERKYETGVDHVVLYKMENGAYSAGVAWNGVSAISQSPSGAEANAVWADNIKYLNILSNEDFAASLEAYMYPDEWEECDGLRSPASGLTMGQQARKSFGLTWRTLIGNDEVGTDYGYKIHFLWNGLAAPAERANNTVNDSPEAMTMSWEISTTAPTMTSTDASGKVYRPTAHMEIDSTKIDASILATIEELIYGTESTDPTLPTPDELISIVTGEVSA